MNNQVITQEGVARKSFSYNKTYNIEIRQSTISNGEKSDCATISTVSKTFIEKNEQGLLYKIIVKNRTQSNKESLRGVENFLSGLLLKVVLVYTDEVGYIKSIANHEEIKEKWVLNRSDFLKRFASIDNLQQMADRMDDLVNSPTDLLDIFKQSDIGTLMFPPVFSESLTRDTKLIQRKFFYNFFGAYALPLLIETKLIANNVENSSAIKVTRLGKLDRTLFWEDEVKEMFREIYDIFPLNVNLTTSYVELFEFNMDATIDAALQIFSTSVGEIYKFDQVIKLTQA